MRRLWLGIGLLLLIGQTQLPAQVKLPQITDKNNQLIGFTTGFSYVRARQPDDSWLWWAEPALAPKWGYFVENNWALGIIGEYFFGNLGTLAKTPSAYSFGYWGRYYLPVKRTSTQKYWGEDGDLRKVKVRKDSIKAPIFRCYFEFAHAYISSYNTLSIHSFDSTSTISYPNVHYIAAGFGANIRLNKGLHLQASVWAVYFLNLPDQALRFSPSVGRIGLEYFFHFPKSTK